MGIKGEKNSNILIVGDFDASLTSKGGPSRQKINQETLALSDILPNIIYITLHLKVAQIRIFFKCT